MNDTVSVDPHKERLMTLSHQLQQLVVEAGQLQNRRPSAFEKWTETCAAISAQLSEEMVRVAVIGSIKSGKSTMVNAIFGGDHLKRGAGVVTSFLTRIHPGKEIKATLVFKSWYEINADIRQALVLVPSMQQAEALPFDLRRSDDRDQLQQALQSLSSDQLISGGARNADAVLLALYLAGFECMQDTVGADATTVVFENEDFPRHRDYVGNDELAVYLKDIELVIDSKVLAHIPDLEIADCQGSDSPNPLHLAMIQDYLLQTNLSIYVISSRTGLRQSDIRFLGIVQKIGLTANILFVLNFDFSEHDSLDDLQRIHTKTREELALLVPQPQVFVFSALFNLFRELPDALTDKDKARLKQWRNENELATFSDEQKDLFFRSLTETLTAQRMALLLKGHLARLELVGDGLAHWISVRREMLTRDGKEAKAVIKRIERQQEKVALVQKQIRHTLDGAVRDIQKQSKSELDRFFDQRSGPIVADLLTQIRNYRLPAHGYRESLKSGGFNATLFLVFQEFKQRLDEFMTSTVNPEIILFTGQIEETVRSALLSLARPFDGLVKDAVADFGKSLSAEGLSFEHNEAAVLSLDDLRMIKQVAGLQLPPATAVLRYSAKVKTEAVMRLGFYRILRLAKRVFRQTDLEGPSEQQQALENAVVRMKRETEQSVLFHLKSYRENLKFQYVSRLIDAVATALFQQLTERFSGYLTDLSDLTQLVDQQETEKMASLEALDGYQASIGHLQGQIDTLRQAAGIQHPSEESQNEH